MQNFNAKIIDKIIGQTSGRNVANRLMEILSISRESAYRRISNRIPFSVEEVTILANRFNFSIDQMIASKPDNNFFLYKDFNTGANPSDACSNLLISDIELMKKLHSSTDMIITATMNRIPFRLLPFQSLFKLEYCHYLYSMGKIPLTAKYADIDIPSQINDLRKDAVACFSRLDNITCIIDSMLYSNIIKKIQYYYLLGFLSGEDLQIIQRELFDLLEKHESLLRTGTNNTGLNYTFYYSFFNIESNIIFIEFDTNSLLQVWVYPKSSIMTTNSQQVSSIRKRWIDSKIRNSVLITKTVNIQQIEMLRNVHKEIEELENF